MKDWTEKRILIGFIIIVTLFTISIVISGIVNGQNTTDDFQYWYEVDKLVKYCFAHIDSPDPIKDLRDKGYLNPIFNNQTCLTLKQQWDSYVRDLIK